MKIIDLHCDTISAIYERNEHLYKNSGHFDIKRALTSSLAVQFFALFAMPQDSDTVLRNILLQIEKYNSEMEENSLYLYRVLSSDDIKNSENKDKIGCVLHLEGGEALGINIEILYLLYRLGLRSMGLTWNARNYLADGVGEGKYAGGLSKFGRQVVEEMEKIGIMLDLSHIAERSFFEALEVYNRPVLVTHANARSLCGHIRNLTDEQLKALAGHGGVVGINQVSSFVKEQNANVDDLIDHIAYISNLIGPEYVALGSDFDGADSIVMQGVEEYTEWEKLLKQRGFNNEETENILYRNAYRIINDVI